MDFLNSLRPHYLAPRCGCGWAAGCACGVVKVASCGGLAARVLRGSMLPIFRQCQEEVLRVSKFHRR